MNKITVLNNKDIQLVSGGMPVCMNATTGEICPGFEPIHSEITIKKDEETGLQWEVPIPR